MKVGVNGGENGLSEATTPCLFVKIKNVFSRTCAGKRHLKSRERGDEREVHGEKTHERASCEVRVLSSRLFSLSSRHKN